MLLRPCPDNPSSRQNGILKTATYFACGAIQVGVLRQDCISPSGRAGSNPIDSGRSFVEPAPFYDLVSLNVYGTEVEQEMAMGYGDEFLLEKLSAYDLADFSQRIGMPAAVLEREMTRLAIRAREIAPVHAQSSLYQGQERELVRAISGNVVKQAAKLLQIAPQVKKVDPELL